MPAKTTKYLDLFNEVLRTTKAKQYPKIGNLIEFVDDTVVIYAFKNDKIYKGYIDKLDIKKICIDRTWCIQGFDKHRSTGYFTDAQGHRMHNLILLGDIPNDKVIDHINGNGLDNRECNLRVVSHRLNMINRKQHINNTSGITGIFDVDNGYKVAVVRKFINKDIAQSAADEVFAILNRYAILDEK